LSALQKLNAQKIILESKLILDDQTENQLEIIDHVIESLKSL
jgi:hypothetical protein